MIQMLYLNACAAKIDRAAVPGHGELALQYYRAEHHQQHRKMPPESVQPV